MALADYYARSALAASQILSGFDEAAFAAKLDATPVGIAFDSETSSRSEGRALLDLLIRLLARVYPALAIDSYDQPAASALASLAREINPAIAITDTANAPVGVCVGETAHRFATTVFAGSDGWDGLIDDTHVQPIGNTANPLGAGAAACLAAAALFRLLFTDTAGVDAGLRLSTFLADIGATPAKIADRTDWPLGDLVLVGAGAIGNAAIWAFGRSPAHGTLHIIDDETLDLGNLQRYVLARRTDEGAFKANLAADRITGTLRAVPHPCSWGEFVGEHGFRWETALIALDSAQARRDVQGSLPRNTVNAWTQPDDLGVSSHSPFGRDGACVSCLYLPDGVQRNLDEIVADALGIPHRLIDVRTLLHNGNAVQAPLLEEIAIALGQPRDLVLAFAGRPIRELYVQGVCGGALVPLGAAGRPNADVHVPVAHQSALAGVLLAASTARIALTGPPSVTQVSRLNVMRRVGASLAQPTRRRNDGRCICEDPDFVRAYDAKWSAQSLTASD